MSHWTTIKTQIKDLTALAAAARELGFIVEQQVANLPTGSKALLPVTSPFGTIDCHVRLSHPSVPNYHIGAQLQPDGTYALVTDWWGWRTPERMAIISNGAKPNDMSRLMQLYGVHKATAEARRKGWMVTRQTGKGGNINLVVCGM